MIGTINCIYGWCSKCNKKIPERGQRAKCNTVDDVMDESIKKVITNKICESESDYEWECTGVSTAGITYRCKKCHATKTYSYNFNSEISITN